jgi:hypothetical protein
MNAPAFSSESDGRLVNDSVFCRRRRPNASFKVMRVSQVENWARSSN